jgi:predicted methyltransferase
MRCACLILLLLTAPAALAAGPAWQDKLAAAMADPDRPAADRARDANRLPMETLAFFGFRDDLRVLELFPGTGWYTRLLGPVLAEKGKLYVALNTRRVAPLIDGTPGLAAVEILEVNELMTSTDRRSVYDLAPLSFFVEDLDLVLTFRNVHNLSESGRAVLNQAVFEALRPGGLYGVIDHTRRHMEPYRPENARRADPVQVIHETIEAGFEFVGYSALHRRPQDDLTLEVGDERVTGRTDRFTLLFRKPGTGSGQDK